MMGALAQALFRRTPRERLLIALLALVVVPFALVALVALPLQDRLRAQAAELAEARALTGWLSAEARRYVPPAPGAQATGAPGARAQVEADLPPIQSAADLEQSLTAAGLSDAATRLTVQDQGSAETGRQSRISLGFDRVAFVPAMEWLAGIAERGITLRSFRIQRLSDAPGLIRLDLTLEPQS